MPSSTSTKTIILNESSDWDTWFYVVKSLASDSGVNGWKYVDPTLPQKPSLPQLPELPTPASVKDNATSIKDLDTNQVTLYQILRSEYKDQLAAAKLVHQSVDRIHRYILETTSAHNLTFVRSSTDTYDILRILKQRLAPTDRARELEITKKYQALRRYHRNENIETYLNNWEKVYAEAAELKIPEVDRYRPLTDFLVAITEISPGFAASEEAKLTDKIDEGITPPTLYKLIEKFRNHRRIHDASKEISQGAFATFKDEEQQKETAGQKKNRPCLCGEDHRFAYCPYLVETARPEGWSPDETIQKLIEEKIKNSEKLRETIDKAREYAATQIQRTQKQSTPTTTPAKAIHPSTLDAF